MDDFSQDEDGRKAIPIFGLGNQSRSPFISSVDRTNCVVEMSENGRQQAAIFGLPGLISVLNLGSLPIRGHFVRKGEYTFYIVAGSQVMRCQLGQTPLVIATLSTEEGPVWIDDNGSQLFINDGATALIYVPSTGVATQITDINYPVGARGGVYLQQRFWVFIPKGSVTNDGRVYGSNQFDGLTWNALNFFTPEAKPDGISAIYRWFNDLVVVGKSSIEWWTGTPSPIVGALGFQPVASANTEVGMEAERGIASVNQRLFIVGTGDGNAGVYELKGYTAEKISPPAIDSLLANVPTNMTAICTGYMVVGHPIFQITIPSAFEASALTIVFDGLTNLWSKRTSINKPYYRGLLAVSAINTVYISDAFTGILYQMSDTTYDENGEAMPFEVTSIHMLKEGDMLSVNSVQVDMETGLGLSVGQGSDPQGMMQISKDGGHTWSAERFVPLGKVGEYKRRASRRRIGAARDIAIRFRITEPIPRRVAGAYLVLQEGVS